MEQNTVDWYQQKRELEDRLAQMRIDEELTGIAIRIGVLPNGATPDEMTDRVKERMRDTWVLKDAIYGKYLSKEATVDDLTKDVREKMCQDGRLHTYRPDGSEVTKEELQFMEGIF